MQRSVYFMLGCLFAVYASVCSAASLIELKSGAHFVTSHYWEDGDSIKFYLYGGVVGFAKQQIKKIRPLETVSLNAAPPETETITRSASAYLKAKPAPPKSDSTQPPPAGAGQSPPTQQQEALKARIAGILEALRRATADNDQEKIKAERKKLLKLQSDLKALQTRPYPPPAQ